MPNEQLQKNSGQKMERWQSYMKRSDFLLPIICVVFAIFFIVCGVLLKNSAKSSFSMTEVSDWASYRFIKLNNKAEGKKLNITISTTEEMALFNELLKSGRGDIGAEYYLLADVALPQNWTPAELYDNFHGMDFEGRCHTISGLQISGADLGGLFSCVGNCTIDHLTVQGIVDARISGGGIAAVAAAGTVLDQCVSEVNVTVSAAGENCFAGGLIGSVAASQGEELLYMVGCQNLGNVNISCGGDLCAAGGILGGGSCAVSSGSVQLIGCRNEGDILSPESGGSADTFTACGGILGAVDCIDQGALTLELNDCVNNGKVGGVNASGGVLGSLRKSGGEEICCGSIARCRNYGTIEHQRRYGNASAPIATAAWAGGIAGCTNGMLALTECANFGAVNVRNTSDQLMVAGILGAVLYSTAQINSSCFGYVSLYSCANYGDSNAVYLAGLLAQNAGFASLADSFSTGRDARGLCKALGNLTASISGDTQHRGGFWAYDIYQADGDSLFYDEFLPHIDTAVRKDDPRGVAYAHGIYPAADTQMSEDAAVMAQRLSQAQMLLPLTKHGQNVYATVGSADNESLTFYGDGLDLNFAADALRGDHTAQADDLKSNPLYWGVRYHGEENAVPVLGQKLSLSLLRNGRTVGGGRVVCLMQKDEAGNYVLAYRLRYDPAADTYTASGVLPGNYALSFDDSFGEGTMLTVEENWQLTGKTETRYCNEKSIELCTVNYCQPGIETPIKTDIVFKTGVLEPPESVPTEEGYVFLGWNTDATAADPLDLSEAALWDLPGMDGAVIKLYAVIVRREPVYVQILADGEPTLVSSVALYSGEKQKAELRYAREKLRYELPFIEDGNYNVYVNGVDTELVLKVRNGFAATVVSYHTVDFYADGDSSAPLLSILVQAGHAISQPLQLPEGIEGSVCYWRTEDGETYDLTAPVNEKLQLYAIWQLTEGELSEDAPASIPGIGTEADTAGISPEQGEEIDGAADGVGDDKKAEPVYYVVNSELEGLALEGKKKASDSKAYTGVLHPEEGFMLPSSIRVVMGDEETELSVDYSAATGVFTIPAGTVSGELTISAAGLPVVNYAVSSMITSSMLYSATANTQTGYVGTVMPNAGYKLPQKLTATMGGAEFTDFTYNASTGVIKVKATAISGDLVFAGSAVPAMQADTYKVTASIGHGSAVVTKNSTAAELEVQIIPEDTYSYPQALLVIAGNRSFTDFSYDASTGILHIGSGKVDRVIISGVCGGHSVPVRYLGDRSLVPKAGFTEGGEGHRISLPFTDVVPGDWCYDSVRFVYEHKLMNGSAAGFKPDSRMTREMLWVALARLDGASIEGNAYSAGRAWAISSGISDGKNGTSPLTRQQFAAMLYRVVGEPAVKGTLDGFSDGASVSAYAKNAILWAEEQGLITGYADGTLRPGAYITRAQAATILMRYYQAFHRS